MGRENELWPGGTLGGGGGRGGGGGFCHNKKCPLTALKGKTEEEEEGGLAPPSLVYFRPRCAKKCPKLSTVASGGGVLTKIFPGQRKIW